MDIIIAPGARYSQSKPICDCAQSNKLLILRAIICTEVKSNRTDYFHKRPGHKLPGHKRHGHKRPGHKRPGHKRSVANSHIEIKVLANYLHK